MARIDVDEDRIEERVDELQAKVDAMFDLVLALAVHTNEASLIALLTGNRGLQKAINVATGFAGRQATRGKFQPV